MGSLHLSAGAHIHPDTPIKHRAHPAGETRPYVVVRVGEAVLGVDLFLHDPADLDRLEAVVQAARADLTAAMEAADEHSRKTFEALAAL